MGFRFQKRIKIAPGVRLNISKKGLSSVTVGRNGANVTVGRNGTVKPHNRLSAIDANYAHLTGIDAMAASIISDPSYKDDDHLLRLMQAISLNARIALDMMQGITAK